MNETKILCTQFLSQVTATVNRVKLKRITLSILCILSLLHISLKLASMLIFILIKCEEARGYSNTGRDAVLIE